MKHNVMPATNFQKVNKNVTKLETLNFLHNHTFNVIDNDKVCYDGASQNNKQMFILYLKYLPNIHSPEIVFLHHYFISGLFVSGLCPGFGNSSLHVIVAIVVHLFHQRHQACTWISFFVIKFRGPAIKKCL